MFIPILRNKRRPLPARGGKLTIGREDGSASLSIGKTGIVTMHGATKNELGTGATQFLIHGTALAAALIPILATLAVTTTPATNPAETMALVNANNVAIVAALSAIQANLSTKTATV